MNAPADIVQTVHRATQLQAELMRREMRLFVKHAWHVVEPGVPYVHGYHIDAICDHLTYVSLGDISDLVINIPPRHSKSTICAVMWPAWEWTWLPHTQWLFSTYAQSLTIRDSIKCRRLIQSPWYQERYSGIFQLSGDMNQKQRFENDKNGHRLATSVGGATTGEGGDRIVVDDAHNMKEINSDLIREGVISWWRDVMSTRANNPKTAGRVIIAQRGHHADLPGYVLESGNWIHLNMPGYYRPDKSRPTYALKNARERHRQPKSRPVPPPALSERFRVPLKKGQKIWEDWRTKPDELLNPERYGPEEMAKLAAELTEKAFEAQIQQNPSIESGNIIKSHHWRKWEEEQLPPVEMVLQFYDTAFEEDEEADFTARTTWGIFEWEEELNPSLPWSAKYRGQRRLCAILLERFNERVNFPDLRAEAMASAEKWKPDRIIVEKRASGHSLAQELRRANLPVTRFRITDSKFVRAHAASLVFERGCMFYVERRWAREVIDQCAQFPSGENDDLVDTVTMCALWLRRRWNAEFIDEEDDTNIMAGIESQPRRIYG